MNVTHLILFNFEFIRLMKHKNIILSRRKIIELF